MIHIIGAGLAGLSAATQLAEAGRRVTVYETAAQAGGRCRSFEDASFGGMIDNGNHLLLSGNQAAMAYLKRISSGFASLGEPVFHFIDAPSSKRWTLRLNQGRIPFWLLNSQRRVPDTQPWHYLSILRLLQAQPHHTAAQRLDTGSMLYQRLWQPLLVSALNTHPQEALAGLAAAVLRGTLLKGGKACIPLVADGLSRVLIDPGLGYLQARGGSIAFQRRLRHIELTGDTATRLDFADGQSITLASGDQVICATPPWEAARLLPGISAPNEFRAILNAHFRIPPPPGFPRMLGVINATIEWIFAFPDRISITISDADRYMPDDREALAQRLWREVAAITGLATTLPPWQIVKEKRATFAATPAQNAQRPATRTRWRNMWLAGDWVQTGLPATIEGAVRSGQWAAQQAMMHG